MPFRVSRLATFTRCSQHRFSIPLTFSSLPQFQPHNFLPWLEKKANSTISSSLYIANSPYGNSLFASNSILTGDCILQVPYSVQITADNLAPEIRTSIGEDVGNIAKLAIVLLIHKNLGQDSEWHPYTNCLPPQEEMHNTIFWNESELDMIRGSSVYQETICHKSQIEKDFLAIRPELLKVKMCIRLVVSGVPVTVERRAIAATGKIKMKDWTARLSKMGAANELAEKQARRLHFNLESSYTSFMAALPNAGN